MSKVIVSNISSLKQKYGQSYAKIDAAIKRLIAADAKRGIETKFIGLDNAAQMGRVSGRAVTAPTDPKENKQAIDAVFTSLGPDYLVILGAVDVVPHQDLRNPVTDDDDSIAWGDLPYACSAPYSRRVEDFRAPTRVVGRIPDVNGAGDPAYLMGLLDVAAGYKCSPRTAYDDYLGISAAVWKKSTELSLQNIFGSSKALQCVPPSTFKWPKKLLSTRAHFINCHGGPGAPQFYGQQGRSYPVAHDSSWITGRVSEGTVVAAECCYGAELYSPGALGVAMGICNAYLASGAYGFFGSSTTAYGPSEGNGSADLICQYFLDRVRAGASLGRATLEARQHFIQTSSTMDPADLKTLAQFSLMGDPSIHPVDADAPALTKTKTYREAFPDSSAVAAGRALRRERLAKLGEAIGGSAAVARASKSIKAKPRIRSLMEKAAREAHLSDLTMSSFSVHDPGKQLLRDAKFRRPTPTALHMAVGRAPGVPPHLSNVVLLIATESDGELARMRRLHAR